MASILLMSVALSAAAEAWAKKPVRPAEKIVSLDSDPQGAKVIFNGRVLGVTPCKATVPLTYETETRGLMSPGKRSRRVIEMNSKVFTFLKEGYVKGEEIFRPDQNFDYPDGVFHIFEKDPAAGPASGADGDLSIPDGEADRAVSRDNPGRTALEKTVIRWYFESEPQGARIFWRVISSVPEQVKNTNELWLGNTPFEETRSFNIPGLTYENSRDVQIEIKVRRNGYIDQVKRFNVRQAVDQQEISSFFDMIRTE